MNYVLLTFENFEIFALVNVLFPDGLGVLSFGHFVLLPILSLVLAIILNYITCRFQSNQHVFCNHVVSNNKHVLNRNYRKWSDLFAVHRRHRRRRHGDHAVDGALVVGVCLAFGVDGHVALAVGLNLGLDLLLQSLAFDVGESRLRTKN